MLFDFFRFVAFSLRPTARSPEVFGLLDFIRAIGALGGVSGLGLGGRWLDKAIQSAESDPATPNWFFIIVLPLAGFALLSLFAGTRLGRRLRLSMEPVLEIEPSMIRRGDASQSGESFGLVVTNKTMANANNCLGQIIDLAFPHPNPGFSLRHWTGGSLQWSPQDRNTSNEAIANVSGLLKANLDIIHHRTVGFSNTRYDKLPRPQFLFAYANDPALAIDNPPPSNLAILMLIVVKGDNIPPVYAVCLFNSNP